MDWVFETGLRNIKKRDFSLRELYLVQHWEQSPYMRHPEQAHRYIDDRDDNHLVWVQLLRQHSIRGFS
jgi:hypothetical protein